MNKLLLQIKKIICGFFGIIFLLVAMGGLIDCFLDRPNIKRYIPLTLIFFALGLALLREAIIKRSKNCKEKHGRMDESSTISANQYIQDGNSIVHTDGSPIMDSEIPYLIQLGYEQTVRFKQESTNPKFHRSEHEEELSYNFMIKHEGELHSYVDQFENLYRSAYETNELTQQIDLLKRSLLAFEKAKKFAYSKGKGGAIYFQDMYEYLHNSNNSCFSYADMIQRDLDSAIQERDVIIPSILHIVNENNGILQKNIYDQLPSVSRSDIQRVIRKLENKNMLTIIKKSNSYELYIVN